jgi:serine/threonine protein phosphatase 1
MAWLRPKTKAPAVVSYAPQGEVVYAIGDIHGRADLLGNLLRQIETDAAAHPDLLLRLVMLGDYIDRGAESRRVLDILVELKRRSHGRMIALRGNHEEAMLEFLDDPKTGAAWCEFGGRETLISYGVGPPRSRQPEELTAARDALLSILPEEHFRFLKDLEPFAEIGDYLFVHAGLRPRRVLAEQTEEDMLWIRDEFLNAPPWMPQVIVHGHTPFAEPSEGPGRIGIDTGAYATGVLTALRLEGDQRRYIQTSP